MRGLPNLIRLTTWHLDELSKRLHILENERVTLENLKASLFAYAAHEAQIYHTVMERQHVLPFFLKHLTLKQQHLQGQLKKIDKETERIKEEMMEKFRDLKRYELALEAKERKEKELRSRHEQAFLDEIASNVARQTLSQERGG